MAHVRDVAVVAEARRSHASFARPGPIQEGGCPADDLAPPNMRLKLSSRLAALARVPPGSYCEAGASAANAPARSLSASR